MYRVANVGEKDYVNFCEDNKITQIMFTVWPYLICSVIFSCWEHPSLAAGICSAREGAG